MADEDIDWSDWLFDPNTRRFYRYRRDDEGNAPSFIFSRHSLLTSTLGDTEFDWPTPELESQLAQQYISSRQASGSVGSVGSGRRRDSGVSTSSSVNPGALSLQSLGQNLPTAVPEHQATDHGNAVAGRARGTLLPRPIRGSDNGSEAESLDSRYRKVKPKDQRRFFTVGRVFLMLWTEPSNPPDPDEPRTRGSTHFSIIRYGETAFSEIRRFIVVQPRERHSLCVPIQTYSNRGVVNRGADAIHHSIAYTHGTIVPNPLPGEQFNKIPIKVVPNYGDPSSDTLGTRSRVNFSKTYTIEHNVKVRDAGKIAPEHQHVVDQYWRSTTLGPQLFRCPNCSRYGIVTWVYYETQCPRCYPSH
ncbi:MAG: hypothetical protein M1820_008055 [Bogoriella megaspora]|nr:MAG: hypothetical protein M1820_008055 [Bogoriella megaspora]